MRPPEKFPWGQIVEEWEIGPYYIAKYHPYKTPRHGDPTGEVDRDRVEYHMIARALKIGGETSL